MQPEIHQLSLRFTQRFINEASLVTSLCGVRMAIEKGDLSEARLQSYFKLEKEATYEGLNAKQIEKKKTDSMFSEFGSIKNLRNFIKNKNKRK